MKKALIAVIRFYQRRISPLFPPRCRYYPTCSQYAVQCLEVHGLIKGSILAILRLMRCNIFFPGGVDPVPPKKEKNNSPKK
ncbi:MAG: membrane protein insertion efficiency factor YidD [Clostridia bacterium]|nr:membrane protein insertion efficiency factor YidD [Clostridia bacterium]